MSAYSLWGSDFYIYSFFPFSIITSHVYRQVVHVLALSLGVWFPWLKSHSGDPRTLLGLAQSEDRAVRHLGVYAMADQPHWSGTEQ